MKTIETAPTAPAFQTPHESTAKMELAIFDVNSQGQFEVHTADCADCAKTKERTGLNFHVKGYATALEVSQDVWSDMIAEGSMTAEGGLSDIDFKPCVKDLPKGFQTPHEAAKATKGKKRGKKKPTPTPEPLPAPAAPAPEPKPAATPAKARILAKVEKDIWGGRVGTRMSKINAVVIAAGKAGATTAEIAAQTKEALGLVSAQLSWHVAKGNCTRTEATVDGKKVSRWTVAKPAKKG